MIPYVRRIEFEYGRCDQVSPLIRRVVANNPGPFTYTGTGTYIVGHGQVAVIDPGPDDETHLAALLAAVAGETVSHILVTHHHADHSPLAAALKAATGAPVIGCPLPSAQPDEGPRVEAGTDLAFRPDITLCSAGPAAAGPGWTLSALPTPGHTSNHICYALAEENCLFSGDHIMGWSTTVITPPDGDMTDYLSSLQAVRGAGFETLWPTHGPPIREVTEFLKAYIAHRRGRETQILNGLATGPQRIRQLVPALYADVDPRLHAAAGRSMLAHMIDLTARGVIASSDGEAKPDSLYRLA